MQGILATATRSARQTMEPFAPDVEHYPMAKTPVFAERHKECEQTVLQEWN